MADEGDRKLIIDRANRMLKQSRSLRKMSAALFKEAKDLRQESNDLRLAARPAVKGRSTRKKR